MFNSSWIDEAGEIFFAVNVGNHFTYHDCYSATSGARLRSPVNVETTNIMTAILQPVVFQAQICSQYRNH